MNRILQFALIAAFSFTACTSPAVEKKPNIIYIYADDMGYGDVGFNGQKYIKTPTLDKMAAEGIKFTDHYTGAPICAPARCILMTGRHSGASYIRNNQEMRNDDPYKSGQLPIPDEEETVAEILKEAGYTTAAIGKWGLGSLASSGSPLKQGFDFFFGYIDQAHAHNHFPAYLFRNDEMVMTRNDSFKVHTKFDGDDPADLKAYDKYKGPDYALDLMTEEAKNFIKENKGNPFFLYLPYVVPHKALQVPDESLEMYEGVFEEEPYLGGRGYSPHPKPLSAFAGMITRMDQKIGEILQLLEELELDENTIVMFSSDNGPGGGGGLDARFFESSGIYKGGKGSLYEGGIREPFIARWTGKIKEGTVTDHVSAQYDLKATLAELVGVDAGVTEGISFLPTLLGRNDEQKKHDYLYWEFSNGGGQYAVRIGDMKGIWRNVSRSAGEKWEVYNLKDDPSETRDLAERHPELIKRFSEIVKLRTPSHFDQWNFETTATGKNDN